MIGDVILVLMAWTVILAGAITLVERLPVLWDHLRSSREAHARPCRARRSLRDQPHLIDHQTRGWFAAPTDRYAGREAPRTNRPPSTQARRPA